MHNKGTYTILQRLVSHTVPERYRRVVRAWLIGGSDREEKEEALHRIWSEAEAGEDISTEEPLKATWEKIKEADRRSARRSFIRRAMRYAAIALLPILSGITVGILTEKEFFMPKMVECYVPYGEQQSVTLPDGSLIKLNSGSLFIYPSRFTSSRRRQVYLSGEGHFSVEKNTKKPFIVRTGDLNIEVLGTKFNIESYPGSDRITTTLEEGAVRVYEHDKPQNALGMIPDDQICYHISEHRFVRSRVESADYSAWAEGELRFINKSLDEIIFTLERRYNVRFLMDMEVKGSDLYTMKFKAHETIDDALFVLGEIIGTISYHKEGQTIRINVKGKEVAP